MYTVYWIHRKEHTDINTQGYVGITKDLKERLRVHKKNKKFIPLTSAIHAYGFDNLEVTVIESIVPLDRALELEDKYRPAPNIGWNLQKGGELGVDSTWYEVLENKIKHSYNTSVATKIGIAAKDTTEKRSERAKLNWQNNKDSYANVSKGSNNPAAILTEEDVSFIRYTLLPYGVKVKDIAKEFCVGQWVIYQIKLGKNWKHV